MLPKLERNIKIVSVHTNSNCRVKMNFGGGGMNVIKNVTGNV